MPTLLDAAAALRAGRLRCEEVLDRCLARIDRLEPRVRAWVLLDRDAARATAVERDRELRHGHDRGPLHGIPVGIKDIFDVFDWPTACGSRRWQHAYARQDAPVVRRLRQAGAVLLGKTVTTAYASFDPPPTRNPWDLDRTPGGSSSGSAAAVATGMCLAALASQTGGSITRPAAYCGVPGCKPTYGLISAEGVLPLAASMDHVGAMAGRVADLAAVMTAIADPGCPDWTRGRRDRPPVFARLRGLFERLAEPAVQQSMDTTCRDLVRLGATVREAALPAAFEEVVARHRLVMAVEAARYHQERLARHPDDYPANIRALLDEGLACPATEYARCKEHQRDLTAALSALFAGVDALICPATTGPAPSADTTGNPAFNAPWSYTGLPVLSIPVALSPDGLPLSLQLVGPHRGEPGLFAVAAWCEQHLGDGIGEPPLARE